MLRCLLIATLLLLPALTSAQGKPDYPSLWDCADAQLQRQLEDILHSLGFDPVIQDRRMAVTLVDITDLENPRVAGVNGDAMMYAASVPKLAILLGAFVEIREGNMALDEATRNSLTEMIRYSSNQEATRMLNRVGKQRLIEILQSNEFGLYDMAGSGGLWVGKEYGKSGAYRRDPLNNFSHGATTMQVARFYYLMETGKVVGQKLSAEMKAMLGDPGISHKFVKGLSDYPDVSIFRKSGTWKRWHGDSALVESGEHRYIVATLIEDSRGSDWLTQMIQPIHELMVPSNEKLSVQSGR